MTCEVKKLVDEAEDIVRKIGRGINALMHVAQSPSEPKTDALAFVADHLEDDFKRLVEFWEKAHRATR